MISARNIAFKAGGKQILHPLSFEAEAGEVTVLLGANGAGKSTLLRLLAGEYLPEQGEILLDNCLLNDYTAPALARKRAVLTQHYSVPLPFNCHEIVLMGRYPYQGLIPEIENNAIVLQCMREMEVEPFAQRMFSTLSGGEQQRVQMARVLAQLSGREAGRDKVLLLDEPTSSLDYLQQQVIMTKIKALATRGFAVIIVMHDLNLTAQYANKILLLREGYLLADGLCNEVLQPPLIKLAYGMDVEIINRQGYPFPIVVPAMHAQKPTANPLGFPERNANNHRAFIEN